MAAPLAGRTTSRAMSLFEKRSWRYLAAWDGLGGARMFCRSVWRVERVVTAWGFETLGRSWAREQSVR